MKIAIQAARPLKVLILVFFSGLHSLAVAQQTDLKAKELLDQLSAKTKAYTTIKADFTYNMDNKSEGIHESQAGSIAIKGNKYFLKISGQEVRCNGKTVWTYLKDANEVQISEVDEGNKEQVTPSNIFTMYEKGFRHQFMKEENENGQVMALVHIYPLDLDEKSYHTIKLHINKSKMEITRVEIMGKEGDVYSYIIKSFQPNLAIGDEVFAFSKSEHPTAEVVDLR